MTMLDDYQVHCKLRGAKIAHQLLRNVRPSLLKRTGIDSLLRTVCNPSVYDLLLYSRIRSRKSVGTCFNHLRDPASPRLVLEGVKATLALVQLTTRVGSVEYFEQLCALLGEAIIGTVWRYAYEDQVIILATIQTLPEILGLLQLGSVRYLKVILYSIHTPVIRCISFLSIFIQALVRQLVYPLLPDGYGQSPGDLKIASLKALDVLISQCAPRIEFWKGNILRGVCSCWVQAVQTGELEHVTLDPDEMISLIYFL